MLKRTKGRFLLTLLVITGLAGTFKNSTLTKPERKLALHELKETKDAFFQSIKGLSKAQLDFRPIAGRQSIKECIYDLALAEKNLWEMLEAAMKEPAATKPAGIRVTDEDLVNSVVSKPGRTEIPELRQASKTTWPSATEAIAAFKALRAGHIKYTRSTTEDLRNHFLRQPFGEVDAYQFILLISAYSARYTRQINEIKETPGFPRQ